ncbi:hypothetical protein BKA70DRAFT_87056 [Coprinopsis sp. MPI-PUGE-AT-0042]|nr:hypothetical protein BKA70DRAFT_87056 [Coprinopsis sp. MPI-PUGE-AT-0042]
MNSHHESHAGFRDNTRYRLNGCHLLVPWGTTCSLNECSGVGMRGKREKEKERDREDGKNGVSMGVPNAARGPTLSTLSPEQAVAAANAFSRENRSCLNRPLGKGRMRLVQTFIELVALTDKETCSDVVARSQGVEHYGSTVYGGACSAGTIFSTSTSIISSILLRLLKPHRNLAPLALRMLPAT